MKYKGIISLSLLMSMTLQQAKAESEDNSALNEKIIKLQQQIDYLMERQNLNQNSGLNKVPELSQNKTSNTDKPVSAEQTKIKFYEIYVLILHMILKVQRVQLRIRQDQYH